MMQRRDLEMHPVRRKVQKKEVFFEKIFFHVQVFFSELSLVPNTHEKSTEATIWCINK